MHLTVVTNNAATEIDFTADATQFEYGQSVKLTVKATEPRFIGAMFAIQVDSAGPSGEALGKFHNFSGDLAATDFCSTSVHTAATWKGESTVYWTPHNDGYVKTTGNTTFKLIWGNGPGNAGYMMIPNPFLYMKTVTIWDPNKWNPSDPSPPPPPPAPEGGCIDTSLGGSYKQSPVFIQGVGDRNQTFPAGQCIPCRFDQDCKSARVNCPDTVGAPIIEEVWATSDHCRGKPDRTKAAQPHFATCPGPTHYSPEYLDLARFVPKLLRDQSPYFKDEATAKRAIEEYRRMLGLIQKYPRLPAVPSKLVDLVWHEHVLDTQRYQRDCLKMFGKYMHHLPSFGGEEEKAELVEAQEEMLKKYEVEYGEKPTKGMWPTATPNPGGGEKMPDCCSFMCVKPSCAGCVGCNAVYCGFDGEQDLPTEVAANRLYLAPAQFGGYVMTTRRMQLDSIPPPPTKFGEGFKCMLQATPEMSLAWTVKDEYIYFQQQLLGPGGWYGIGLNDAPSMGMADYMVTMSKPSNFTGVKDMYIWNQQAGYPCWDVLHECSVGNLTKGTKDVEDDAVTRTTGVTTSTWNRKLVTGDMKDFNITRSTANVTVALFAWGEEDYFYYHKDNYISCNVDFFTGVYKCGVSA